MGGRPWTSHCLFSLLDFLVSAVAIGRQSYRFIFQRELVFPEKSLRWSPCADALASWLLSTAKPGHRDLFRCATHPWWRSRPWQGPCFYLAKRCRRGVSRTDRYREKRTPSEGDCCLRWRMKNKGTSENLFILPVLGDGQPFASVFVWSSWETLALLYIALLAYGVSWRGAIELIKRIGDRVLSSEQLSSLTFFLGDTALYSLFGS